MRKAAESLSDDHEGQDIQDVDSRNVAVEGIEQGEYPLMKPEYHLWLNLRDRERSISEGHIQFSTKRRGVKETFLSPFHGAHGMTTVEAKYQCNIYRDGKFVEPKEDPNMMTFPWSKYNDLWCNQLFTGPHICGIVKDLKALFEKTNGSQQEISK
eukprot:TRINITY_DN17294_c0_g1_i1.p1 TRINITY_DN17294_c0_g1~~TRINITY_DN17294_c0_g1_i1.p1  ORF type:complete len:155 (-),score=23.50 TRINITY_DN17294_c0_g1_i1:21-485(-)